MMEFVAATKTLSRKGNNMIECLLGNVKREKQLQYYFSGMISTLRKKLKVNVSKKKKKAVMRLWEIDVKSA